MAKAARTPRPGMTYLNVATEARRPIFEISRVAESFIETLLHYRTLGHYKLHAYVVLPDHVHLLLTPQSITLDQAVALIKNGFTHRVEADFPIWEDGYTGYSIANMHDLEIIRTHLYQLPVRANLAPAPELYPHSSNYRHALPPIGPASVSAVHSPEAASPKQQTKNTATSLRKKAS